ncbi:hypothetical protein CEUSTIGMA_g10497.t1 [Chlamydomonas eustigma]|uniref:Uncharacterized protein n=1 Tax=Chlamydomonas eustigma TaxID=1157962 RepID=A0A250XJ10_9CHLO|nr:hypothetical protein CEUSTIGMA_g10497.t1 [Chlamydomonas eustigma]|eukprot:GAX83071.1 hypothetical protein CEUSTIGMA_g10497.t1 [Chlamydomonas eustigma]
MRGYQRQFLQYATHNNVIVFLDTGTGKTRIAVELIKQYEHQLKEKSQIALFLAPSVPLIMQQSEVLRTAGIKTATLCGDLCQEKWGPREWESIISTYTALAITPDACVYAFIHAKIKMERVGLLILDECHHTSSNHPYAVLLEAFYHPQPMRLRPKVLCLTASPTQAKNLQQITDSLIVAPKDLKEVTSIVPRAQPHWCEFPTGVLKETSHLSLAVARLADALKLMNLITMYADIKDVVALRTKFGVVAAERKEDTSDVMYVEQLGPGRKDLEHIKQQVGALHAALSQLGPWPAAIILSRDLLSAINKLPEDFSEVLPYMLGELIDNGNLGSELEDAAFDSGAAEAAVMDVLSTSPYPDCAVWGTSRMRGIKPKHSRFGCLEEATLVHVLLSVTKAISSLLSPSSVDLDAIMADMERALLLENEEGALLIRNDGRLQDLGVRIEKLVPSELLDEIWSKIAPDSGSQRKSVDESNGYNLRLPLVEPRVIKMLEILVQAKKAAYKQETSFINHGNDLESVGPYMDWGAIVFATRKTTCLALDTLLKNIPELSGGSVPEFRSSMFVGHSDLACNAASLSMNKKQQESVRKGFSSGHLNVLFATSVGSEGLDFRQCQLVLCFDRPDNVVNLVQSGGRARADNAEFILMYDSSEEKQILKLQKAAQTMQDTATILAEMNMATMDKSMRFAPLKMFGLQTHSASGSEDDEVDEYGLWRERVDGAYRVPSTGALMLLQYVQSTIELYCRCLPGNDRWSILQPYYAYSKRIPTLFSCTLYLPNNAAVPVVKAEDMKLLSANKSEAKKKICMEAVKRLHEAGALDDNLLPRLGSTQPMTAGIVSGKGITERNEKVPQSLPKVQLTQELPHILLSAPVSSARQQASAAVSGSIGAKTSRYLYCFDISAKDEEGSGENDGLLQGSVGSQLTRFGVLLPNPLPPACDLPSFPVSLSGLQNGAVTLDLPREGDATLRYGRIRSVAGTQHDQSRNQTMGEDDCHPLVFTAAEMRCIEVCSSAYNALMVDAAKPA